MRLFSEWTDSIARQWRLLLTGLLGLALAGGSALAVANCAPAREAQPSSADGGAAPATGLDIGSDDLKGLGAAIDAQCAMARPPAPWPALCTEWRTQRQSPLTWVARRFEAVPLCAPDGADQGIITGYYEPVVNGSRTRENPRQVPLLRRPPADSAAARWPRAQLENQTPSADDVVAWVDDPVDAYFLQIQGSGRVQLRDGSVMRVGYGGDNGHTYRAIGRDLIDRGIITPAGQSAQSIADWLRANPVEGREIMQRNPRFVFFRETGFSGPPPTGTATGNATSQTGAVTLAGPAGSLGVPLTALRSVAVDPKLVPLGSLLWLEVADPRGGQLRRLVLAQDTGAAILGSPRADLYWGTGSAAGEAAGKMKSKGRLWWLRPRP